MTNQSTIDKLIEMRLTSMSDAFIVNGRYLVPVQIWSKPV